MVTDTTFASYRGVIYLPSHPRDILSFISGLPAPNSPPPRSPKRLHPPLQTFTVSNPQSYQRKQQITDSGLHARQTLFWHPALGMIDEACEDTHEPDSYGTESHTSTQSSTPSTRSDNDTDDGSYQHDVDVNIDRGWKSEGKSTLRRTLSVGIASTTPRPASTCAGHSSERSLRRSWSLRSQPRSRSDQDQTHTTVDRDECVGRPYSETTYPAPPVPQRQRSVRKLFGRLRVSTFTS
jgi:hypothetical protein